MLNHIKADICIKLNESQQASLKLSENNFPCMQALGAGRINGQKVCISLFPLNAIYKDVQTTHINSNCAYARLIRCK